ncbi:Vegetative incompatibility protein HET-E-1 [Cytospora mali]|uniref:Vegetative incompatibility protein HET-E-1 n=1 Tax=Cytospora mali TaxID=578113 RepID=A0A194UTL8_CYTMA|nr:Vegetative incompatibility protein HET-E-1 [Valsa mali var. pyri (nom. inval.)]
MRLLNTKSLELSTFPRDCPPYAILSHTWGDNEAPFEAFIARPTWRRALPRIRKHKYPKVVKACSLARTQGYDWIWIDTCCIDKSSSTELSEAINSMYRYYEMSGICFAYLTDVEVDTSSLRDEIATSLAHSRWFTRGWTLQELIAPAVVEFYNKDWVEIGTKVSLSSALEKITSIPDGLFSQAWYQLCAGGMARQSLQLLSAAQKLSWAATRETTRAEDIAYCLMGLFDVHMPLLYGEGEAKAFARLQAEIAKNTNDQSLFAWGAWYDEDGFDGTVLCYSLFASHPSCFSGLGIIRTTYGRLVSILDHWAPPFEMPNDGYLRIKMRICRNEEHGILGFMDDDHVAFLECDVHGRTDMAVGMFVKRLDDVNGMKRFIRVRRLLGKFSKAIFASCPMEDILLGALPRHVPRFNFLGSR